MKRFRPSFSPLTRWQFSGSLRYVTSGAAWALRELLRHPVDRSRPCNLAAATQAFLNLSSAKFVPGLGPLSCGPSASNALLPNPCLTGSFSPLRSQPKCHLLRKAHPDQPSKMVSLQQTFPISAPTRFSLKHLPLTENSLLNYLHAYFFFLTFLFFTRINEAPCLAPYSRYLAQGPARHGCPVNIC